MKLPADYSDILGHPDMGVRATGAAMVYAARLYGPALRAAVGAPEGADVVAHLAAHFTGEASWEVTRRIAEAGVPVEEEHG